MLCASDEFAWKKRRSRTIVTFKTFSPGAAASLLPHYPIRLEPQPGPVGFATKPRDTIIGLRMEARMEAARDGEDRAEGLAGASVAGRSGHPSLSNPDHAEAGDRSPSHRSLTGGISPRPGAASGRAGEREAGGTEPADPPSSGR